MGFKIYDTEKGFSVIQIITLIIFFGIIVFWAIRILKPFDAVKMQRDRERKADLQTIQEALRVFYVGNGYYPASSLDIPTYRIIDLGNNVSDWGKSFNPYLSRLPKDPLSYRRYVYYSPGNTEQERQSYYLYAALESDQDKDSCNKGNACKGLTGENGAPSADSCGAVCNYGVSSPNVTP